MHKLLLVSKRPPSARFFQEALNRTEFEIHLITPETIDKERPRVADYQMALFDLSQLSASEQDAAIHLVKECHGFGVPSLALIPANEVRMRYRFIQAGVTDYLYLPFDKLDIRIRVYNILRYSNLKDPQSDRLSAVEIRQVLRDMGDLLHRVSNQDKKTDSLHPFEKTLQMIRRQLNLEQVLLFRVDNHERLMLEEMVPTLSFLEGMTIPLDDQLVEIAKAVHLKKNTILNQISANNNLLTYLKSFFNIDIRAFAVFPVIHESRVRAILLLIRTSDIKFSDYDFNFLEVITKILELQFQLAEKSETDGPDSQAAFKFLEHVINQLNFGILVLDHNHTIRYLNKPAVELIQQQVRNCLNRPLEEVIGQQNADLIFHSLRETEGAYERPEIEISGRNNEKLLIGFSVSEFLNSHDDSKGYLISLKDITYSKELQEEMRRMDRLASLGVMASGIAHEIRNPLAGIKAIAQTFEDELEPDDPKNEFVKRIIKQVNRLDEMLKTLFSYAKPQRPNRQFHQIEEILRDVLSLLKQNLYKQNIKLSQSFAAHVPALFIDNSQIQQVLFNLLLNSIESIEKDGEISIQVEPVPSDFPYFMRKPFYKTITERPYVHVWIHDNGCGIPKEDLQKIFNPFFTTKTFGTGLGLSIVYQIVKENDGIIYFESKEGEGTDCHLFLPSFDPDKQENGN